MSILSNVLPIVGLIIGFGFVIFWHELGHFLAAKWVGIKVEQFAVGMGHAIVSFRKGIGVKLGNTRIEYERRIKEHLQSKSVAVPTGQEEYTDAQKSRAAEELGLGETEYRLSWIPIGGYVKMLGQDDMRPGADAEDPRAFNKKTIPQRMLVVSAGVIMNIILAAILFMVLFMMGFHAPAPVVGQVAPGSPAQQAGITSGDTIIDFDGTVQHDFTKIGLNTALASDEHPTKVHVRHIDGSYQDYLITPVKPEGASKAFLQMGLMPSYALEGMKETDWPADSKHPDLEIPGMRTVKPGDVITHVNGQAVRPSNLFTPGDPGDYHKFIEAIQNSQGQPVKLTIKRKDGKIDNVELPPHFERPFMEDKKPFNIAGIKPRMRVECVSSLKSPVLDKIKPGDVIESIEVHSGNAPAGQPGDRITDVSVAGFIKTAAEAGEKGQTLDITVLRDGKSVRITGIKDLIKVGVDKEGKDRMGVGIATGFEDEKPVVASVIDKSPAAVAKGGIVPGSLIVDVDGKPVKTWFDVRDALEKEGEHTLALLPPQADKPVERKITLAKEDVKSLQDIRLTTAPLLLGEEIVIRKTGNPAIALGWGVQETRDLILQFYVTLQRMFGGSVSASNLMGPIGIVGAGAKFASKGSDWLLWFLAMISANLAVVNFLPIPIVDGGLFLFLIIEKIQGRPLSKRAQEYAQIIGLALILSVFLMVTYNDIKRFF